MGRRYALTCTVILALCAALAGCGPRGFQNPREAALGWSRALLAGDYATLENMTLASPNASQLATSREQLGLPNDTTNVEVVVLDELDHGRCSLIDIVYRRAGQDLSPHTPLVALLTEAGWWVTGIPHAATSPEKRLIDPVVAQYLAVLASTESSSGDFPLSPDAPTQSRITLRNAAFGRFAASSLSNLRVQSVTGQVVSPYAWFATAAVTASQGRRPVSFLVELSGTMAEDVDPTGVSYATLGAELR